MTPTRRTTTARRAAAVLSAAALLSGWGAATAAPAQAAPLATGEQASSPNMTLLKNLPKSGQFATTSAFNSDMAFSGDHAFVGNYNGFTIYNIKNPAQPVEVVQVVCPGAQNDISVYENLVVLSTDSSRNNPSCSNTAQSATIKESWEGLKFFDISDIKNPRYVASVETACGSHTHTLAPQGRNLFVYVSSYFPDATFPDCQPPHDKLSVVQVPMGNPAGAKVIAAPVVFPDGGYAGDSYTRQTSGCHDVTAYVAKNLMAGACMGDGVLFDISNRLKPRIVSQVRDKNFAFWHSATFNNDATKIVFTDELGGGGAATCNPAIGPTKGANGIYDLVGGQMVFASYYKISREQTKNENCVAHNGNLIPVPGKDLMVQAWYQGGISVFDFTDSKNPREIGWFDRGQLAETLVLGGSWSAYWYDGNIYSSDIQKGFDVLKLSDPAVAGALPGRGQVNVQSQTPYGG